MNRPIVVVGSINLDLVARAERIPAVGETVSGHQFRTFFGGKGANQAVAAARLGYPVCMIGRVGDDAFGVQLREALEQDGIDVNGVEETEGESGVALIATSDAGENSIIVVPGANGKLTVSDLERHRATIESAAVVLTQLEIPIAVVERISEITRAAGVPLVLDPAPARALDRILLQRIDWLTPNEAETEALLTSISKDLAGQDIERAAEHLLAMGPRNLILKCGERGALVVQESGFTCWIPGFKVHAVDTTAAGDAFNGAFAVGLALGKSPVESAEFASAVAAISVTRDGAQPSMPKMHEVEEFLKTERRSLRNAAVPAQHS